MSGASLIGLISDTHGLLRPEALAALEGSELIIHAGDTGDPKILEQLRAVAPVVAVRENIDTGGWASQLPMTAVVEARSALIYRGTCRFAAVAVERCICRSVVTWWDVRRKA